VLRGDQRSRCEARPFEMTFRYNAANNCSQSYNNQSESLFGFGCDDFGSLPRRAYITMGDLGGGETYSSGFVNANDYFVASTEDRFLANMNISINNPHNLADDSNEIIRPENLMQTLKFHSSCSVKLLLSDRFGAVQLVEFANKDQGLVSNLINTTLQLVIDIPAFDEDSVELLSLVITTNRFGTFDFAEEISGMVFRDGDGFVSNPISFLEDSSVQELYTFQIEIVGTTISGMQGCIGDISTNFSTRLVPIMLRRRTSLPICFVHELLTNRSIISGSNV
jgi:hypothetical protein